MPRIEGRQPAGAVAVWWWKCCYRGVCGCPYQAQPRAPPDPWVPESVGTTDSKSRWKRLSALRWRGACQAESTPRHDWRCLGRAEKGPRSGRKPGDDMRGVPARPSTISLNSADQVRQRGEETSCRWLRLATQSQEAPLRASVRCLKSPESVSDGPSRLNDKVSRFATNVDEEWRGGSEWPSWEHGGADCCGRSTLGVPRGQTRTVGGYAKRWPVSSPLARAPKRRRCRPGTWDKRHRARVGRWGLGPPPGNADPPRSFGPATPQFHPPSQRGISAA